MAKPKTLEVHSSRKLAKAAARALKRAGRAKRLSIKRLDGLHLVRGVEARDWDESTANSEYPRRLRYHLGGFKSRKRALKALLKTRKQHKAHYQLLRESDQWVLATFDSEAYWALRSAVSATPLSIRSDEFANVSSDRNANLHQENND